MKLKYLLFITGLKQLVQTFCQWTRLSKGSNYIFFNYLGRPKSIEEISLDHRDKWVLDQRIYTFNVWFCPITGHYWLEFIIGHNHPLIFLEEWETPEEKVEELLC